MELGWIDFSRTDRNKVLNVLDLLGGEKGVLDELGIGPIRDGFSDLFFPGTSTLQTRAKYFLITAYILRDLELDGLTKNLEKELNNVEEYCGKIFYKNNHNEKGIIGINNISRGKWVKTSPSSIYWAGIRKYGIFKINKTLNDYLKIIASENYENNHVKKLYNKKDENDIDAGLYKGHHLLNIKTYKRDWKDNLRIELTEDEGKFLKEQIIKSYGDTMLGFILENNLTEVLEYKNFQDLENIIFKFPKEIQNNFYLARDFSNFNYFINTIYNLIISDENTEAIKKYNEFKDKLDEITNIDLYLIFSLLNIRDNRIKQFLLKSKELIKNQDIDNLKSHIKNRELILKGQNRAKTWNPNQYKIKWYNSKDLDYRFKDTQNIIKDIFISQGLFEEINSEEEQ